jgi:hypothetical protein
MEFFAVSQSDGSFHAVYRIPGTNMLSSVSRCLTLRAAQQVAREEARARPEYKYVEPFERAIPKGFYTDEDAA